MAAESESESKTAMTAKRSKAERGGNQRTESMYLDCRNLWIWGGSESAVIAIVKGLGFYSVLLSHWLACFCINQLGEGGDTLVKNGNLLG